MTESERSTRFEVLPSAEKRGPVFGSGSAGGPVAVSRGRDRPGEEAPRVESVADADEGPAEDDASERRGSSHEGDDAAGVEGSSGPTAAKDVNQSLARLEMNSLEVKLFLDSIDQRISRMEPRLEGILGAESEAARAEAPVRYTEGEAGELAGEQREALPETPVPPAPGPTAERRRRAQGVPVERRREAHAVPVEEYEKESWGFQTANALLRRRWVPVAVVACLTLMIVVLLMGPGHHARPTAGAVTPTEASPVVAAAPPVGEAKSSADVPWETRAGTEANRPASVKPMGAAHDGGTGRPVIEQGVRAPQQLVATPETPASTQGNATPIAAVTTATMPGGMPATPSSSPTASNLPSTGAAPHEYADAGPQPMAASGATSGRVIPPVYKRVNVSSGVMAGNLIYSPQPAYPKGFASIFHPQGEVMMQAIISKRGRVENLKVISGHMMLRGAAKDAVRTWRYRPYTVNGSAVEVATIVSVEFHK